MVHELEHVVQLGRRKNRHPKDKDCPVGQTVRSLKIVSQHFQLSLPTSLLLESGISGPVGAIALHSSAECWKGGSCGLSSKLGTCNLGLQLGTSQGAQRPGTAWTPNLFVNWFCQSLTGPIFWQCFTKLWLMFCHWHWQWIFWDLVHTAPDTLRPQPRQTGGVLLLGPTWGMRLNFSLRSWSQQFNWEAGDIMWKNVIKISNLLLYLLLPDFPLIICTHHKFLLSKNKVARLEICGSYKNPEQCQES